MLLAVYDTLIMDLEAPRDDEYPPYYTMKGGIFYYGIAEANKDVDFVFFSNS